MVRAILGGVFSTPVFAHLTKVVLMVRRISESELAFLHGIEDAARGAPGVATWSVWSCYMAVAFRICQAMISKAANGRAQIARRRFCDVYNATFRMMDQCKATSSSSSQGFAEVVWYT